MLRPQTLLMGVATRQQMRIEYAWLPENRTIPSATTVCQRVASAVCNEPGDDALSEEKYDPGHYRTLHSHVP